MIGCHINLYFFYFLNNKIAKMPRSKKRVTDDEKKRRRSSKRVSITTNFLDGRRQLRSIKKRNLVGKKSNKKVTRSRKNNNSQMHDGSSSNNIDESYRIMRMIDLYDDDYYNNLPTTSTSSISSRPSSFTPPPSEPYMDNILKNELQQLESKLRSDISLEDINDTLKNLRKLKYDIEEVDEKFNKSLYIDYIDLHIDKLMSRRTRLTPVTNDQAKRILEDSKDLSETNPEIVKNLLKAVVASPDVNKSLIQKANEVLLNPLLKVEEVPIVVVAGTVEETKTNIEDELKKQEKRELEIKELQKGIEAENNLQKGIEAENNLKKGIELPLKVEKDELTAVKVEKGIKLPAADLTDAEWLLIENHIKELSIDNTQAELKKNLNTLKAMATEINSHNYSKNDFYMGCFYKGIGKIYIAMSDRMLKFLNKYNTKDRTKNNLFKFIMDGIKEITKQNKGDISLLSPAIFNELDISLLSPAIFNELQVNLEKLVSAWEYWTKINKIKGSPKLRRLVDKAKAKENERNAKFKNKGCTNFDKYVNLDLGINVIGTSQPYYDDDKFKECFELLREENVTLYITFNDNEEYVKTLTEKEKKNFNLICPDGEKCKFISIPVQDYTAPTRDNLKEFWRVLDDFHAKRKEPNNIRAKENVLMHCTAGHGRTGFMIISYIWYKRIKENKNYLEGVNEIEEILLSEDDDNIKYKSIKETESMTFLQYEIKKYSEYSFKEVFDEAHKYKLFLNRIRVFIEAIREE